MISRSRIIFIDWYQTLSFDLFWQNVKKKNPTAFECIQTNIFHDAERSRRWMTGHHSSEDICQYASRCSGISADELFSDLQNSCVNQRIHPVAIEIIKELRNTHHIFIVTDNMDCFSRFTIPALDMTAWTDGISNSSDIKRFKNDLNGQTFRDIANSLDIRMTEAICVDDSSPTCELIRSLGGTAMQTTSALHTLDLLKSINSSP
jgi:FMN phosphatase YigB (HAD superfamily)